MRGGQTLRQRTQICETTPDASGNVLQGRSLWLWDFLSGAKQLNDTNAMHCSGQRGDDFIGNDTCRPKLIMNYEW